MSDRRIAFLRYIVEETLAGRARGIKGYTVAIAVYGRDETFDAQSDPVVRLEARRLRRDLDTYYAGPGRHDYIRISIPKGGYVPRFEWSEDALLPQDGDQDANSLQIQFAGNNVLPTGGNSVRRGHWTPGTRLSIALLALVIVLIAAWILNQNRSGPSLVDARGEPGVIVLPFETLGSDEFSNYLATGLNQDLISKLMRFPGFRVFTRVDDPGQGQGTVTTAGQLEPEAVYIINGTIHDNTDNVYVSAQLQWAKTGEVIWAANYDRPFTPVALVQIQEELAGAIATQIGQPYGAVSEDLNTRLATPAVSSMQSYVCVFRGFVYRRSFS
ncbi:MAG: hypothetical protein WBS20_03205, partial [Lysobacterales bacterium]